MPRRLIVLRHGERMDVVFNINHDNWVVRTFDETGEYESCNMNMPSQLPNRLDSYNSWNMDNPLTEVGYLHSKMIGHSLLEQGVKLNAIYVSPSYRCIQTATGILSELGDEKLLLHVDPALFEWLGFFKFTSPPNFLTNTYLSELGYKINMNYEPFMKSEVLNVKESIPDYYQRSHQMIQRILERHTCEDETILVVAHNCSLETCTRMLVGQQPRTTSDLNALWRRTYFGAALMAEENGQNKSWKLTEPPILPFQYRGNASYEWEMYQTNQAPRANIPY